MGWCAHRFARWQPRSDRRCGTACRRSPVRVRRSRTAGGAPPDKTSHVAGASQASMSVPLAWDVPRMDAYPGRDRAQNFMAIGSVAQRLRQCQAVAGVRCCMAAMPTAPLSPSEKTPAALQLSRAPTTHRWPSSAATICLGRCGGGRRSTSSRSRAGRPDAARAGRHGTVGFVERELRGYWRCRLDGLAASSYYVAS